MLDTVINGTRTSRSILGNLSIPEDWALARAQLVGEGWPIDFGPLNDAGLSQRGTDLSKSTLLKDTTAALYGLGSDATPDDVLRCGVIAKIATGFYQGTASTTSEESPIEIYTGFRPKYVEIFQSKSYILSYAKDVSGYTAGMNCPYHVVLFGGTPDNDGWVNYPIHNGLPTNTVVYSITCKFYSNKLAFYSGYPGNAATGMNTNQKYYYIAIG